jgi:hypothetical protein
LTATLRKTGWLILLILLWSGPPAAANLYHWTDADGIRHFSNTLPPNGAEASVLMEEIPYDPETDAQRRTQEDAMLEERESAEIQERLEAAEREAEEARRQAEEAKRKADRLEKEIEAQEDDRSYGVYYPRRQPGHRPPGWRPPGPRPPAHRPPGQKPPVWRPRPEPYSPSPKQPYSQPRGTPSQEQAR